MYQVYTFRDSIQHSAVFLPSKVHKIFMQNFTYTYLKSKWTSLNSINPCNAIQKVSFALCDNND
jgi:hypothetical protein